LQGACGKVGNVNQRQQEGTTLWRCVWLASSILSAAGKHNKGCLLFVYVLYFYEMPLEMTVMVRHIRDVCM